MAFPKPTSYIRLVPIEAIESKVNWPINIWTLASYLGIETVFYHSLSSATFGVEELLNEHKIQINDGCFRFFRTEATE